MGYQALYRRWRPQRFGEVVGQEHVVRTLKNALLSGRLAHAYLFCGPRGTGKTSTAKILAKALNCREREEAEPCNRCPNCRGITAGTSLDVVEIDAASHRGIDEVRELREKMRFSPVEAGYRVYIIDEVHMLTTEAFNALLKTLEEPPAHVLFVLATTEPHRVPLTILSRCQRFDFRPLTAAEIAGRLREVAAQAGVELEEGALLLIARAAGGSLRDALALLDQAAAYGNMVVTAEHVHRILGTVEEEAVREAVRALVEGRADALLSQVAALAEEGKDLRLFAAGLVAHLRDLLVERVCGGAGTGGVTLHKDQLLRALTILNRAEQEMKWATQPRIVLEVALVEATMVREVPSLYEVARRLEMLEERLKGGGSLPGKGNGQPPAPAGHRAEGGGGAALVPPDGRLLEEIRQRWPQILDLVRARSVPVYSYLVRSRPHEVRGGTLVLAFGPDDDMLKNRLAEPLHRQVVEEVLEAVMPGRWEVRTAVVEGLVPEEPEEEEEELDASSAIRLFGGEELI
ncbi:DNA polymerase III subunit gamma/tau [Desulfovirgula thermocuniculi]|uniref:DNA polymerase III subunit gamma/tau n=1 Tax=Desulfovirgula thermocuniculi TaxID=348842 RepID=UPI000414E588|nr:DNA polymerase III subunit gamma/tau [Desulfovirgula thermocuniculi]